MQKKAQESQTISKTIIFDDENNPFKVKTYSKIVSLVPSVTEILFDFGLSDFVLGITKYCVHPKNAKETPRIIVGGTKNPDLLLIKQLKPDLIIVNKEENRLKDFNILKSIAPVFITFPKTIFDAIQLMEKFLTLLKVKKPSVMESLDEIKNIYSQVLKRTQSLDYSQKPIVFCPIWKKPWITINKNTFAHDMLVTAGAINPFATYSDLYPRVELSDIILSKPDIILLPDEPYPFSEKDIKELHFLPEFKNVQIFLIDGTFHYHSTRIGRQLLNLSNTILKE